MAMSVHFTTVNGLVLHENRGGAERTYSGDALGSTVAMLDMSGNLTDTFTYWPYGEVISHVGTSTTALTFLGLIGYWTDFGNQLYVRARHLRTDLGIWQTQDPLWPNAKAYRYVSGCPTMRVDPTGLLDPITVGIGALGGGIVGGIWGGLSTPTNIGCGAFCGAIVGALAGAATTALAESGLLGEAGSCVAGAINGLLGSVGGSLCDRFCSVDPVKPCVKDPLFSPPCAILSAGIGLLIGCFVPTPQNFEGQEFLINLMANMQGNGIDPACKLAIKNLYGGSGAEPG